MGYADKAESQTSAEAAGVSHFGWPLLLRNLKKVHTLRLKRFEPSTLPFLPLHNTAFNTESVSHRTAPLMQIVCSSMLQQPEERETFFLPFSA